MSVPLELLKKLNLPPEQLAMLEAASRETKQSPPSPRSNHDDLSVHLEQILNAPAGLNKWSTDPINRMSFLMPDNKGRGSLSKSVDALFKSGKENKRGSEIEDEEKDCEFIKGGLKKAKSIESLNNSVQFKNPFAGKIDLRVASPPPAPKRSHGLYSPNISPREMYAWNEECPQRTPIAQATSVNPKEQRPPVANQPKQPTLSPNANASRPQSRFSLSRLPFFSRKNSTVTSPVEATAVIAASPETKPIECKTISPEARREEIEEQRPSAVDIASIEAPSKKDYSLQDLMLELGLPSATSSLNVEPPTTANDADKYGSFNELSSQMQKPILEEKNTFDFELEEVLSATQSEPAVSHAGGPLSEPDLDRHRSIGPSGFSGMIQRRFFSKHQIGSLGSSQLTMVASQDASIDALLLDDPTPSALQLPLLSPSYSAYLHRPKLKDSSSRSDYNGKPEYETLSDPYTSALLNGVKEEITANDNRLYLNFRNCMRHKHTGLPISFIELKQRIEEYGLDIQFQDEEHTSDVKQLFLLPINNTTVPRWIPPGTTFRIGRQANWFLSQTRVVSRNHCELFHDIHSYYIRDVGSRSGTFVNGTRLSQPEQLSTPKELKHGDIVQIGVDLTSEADPYGQIPNKFKSGQCMALYGYKTRASVPSQREVEDLAPTRRVSEEPKAVVSSIGNVISITDSKFERMVRKAIACKSRLASSNTRLYIEFGDYISDTAAGTAILCRKAGDPSYSFTFNNYRLSWDISMTCRTTGRVLGMKLQTEDLGKPSSYIIYEGHSGVNIKALITIQGDQKLLIEPIYRTSLLDESEMIAEQRYFNKQETTISIPSPSPYILASPTVEKHSFSRNMSYIPVVSLPLPTAQPSSVTPRNPFYTVTGDIESGGLVFYVERYQNCRKQVFLGEGQLAARKSQWGKKTIFYEARLPPAECNDDLLAIVTLFNVLYQVEKF